ncbi:CoA transferase [Myxococcota bacterium]|nr:CoA transferase [Myxococcota bacterium]
MAQVLDSFRVIDLTQGPVGGFASMVLADFGADVIKVEPPGGDRFRALAASPMWLRGKRSVELDLESEGGRSQAHALAQGADVLMVGGPPSRAQRWGLDADAALERQPALIHCSITAWGSRGPYAEDPGYEGLVAARSGRMRAFERQLRRKGPAFAAVPVASHAAAQGAIQGITAALLARQRNGRGQRVETSLLQALMPYDLLEMLLVQLAQRQDHSLPTLTEVGGDMPTLNYHPVLAGDDRWIQCGNLLEHLFLAFLESLGLLGEMLAEERFQDSPDLWNKETVEAARDRILTRVREKTAAEWMAIFHENGNVAAEPYQTAREALSHPDLVDNGDVIEIVDPELGPVRQLGPIARLCSTPAVPQQPAPRVGQHNHEILGEERNAPDFEATPTSQPGQPLEGVLVLEIATIIAAPLGAAMLADLGARVVRIEPVAGDPYRHMIQNGSTAVKTTAGKESICLDLKSEEGRAIAQDLAQRADVLIHNFRPGVPERLGIGYAELRERNPGLVWVSVNGYGPDGPSANRPSTHPVPGAAMSGATHQSGAALTKRCESLEEIREISRQLMRANESNPDPNTSVVIGSAVLLALLAKVRHGMGQTVYVNMLTANAYANGEDFLDYAGKRQRPAVDADLFGLNATYRLYPARSGWVFLAMTTQTEWKRFCEVADFAPDDRFETHEQRCENEGALTEVLGTLFQSRDADEWEQKLLAQGVGCVRADGVSPGSFWALDPHVLDNGFAPLCHHARFGEYRRWGPLVTVGDAKPSYGPGTLAGQHTDAILAELGLSAERIAELRNQQVVASEPV